MIRYRSAISTPGAKRPWLRKSEERREEGDLEAGRGAADCIVGMSAAKVAVTSGSTALPQKAQKCAAWVISALHDGHFCMGIAKKGMPNILTEYSELPGSIAQSADGGYEGVKSW